MKLRDAMRFDADRAALYPERGWWSPADSLSQWLVRAASQTPDAPAIAGDGRSLSRGAHPQVDMAAIVPIPDPVPGERACCCITVAGDVAPPLEAICAYLDEHGVAKMRWPERLETVDAMPLTATRKIIRGRLTERLRGERHP